MKYQNCETLSGQLPIITPENCMTTLEQLQRGLFQKLQTPNTFTETSIIDLATWTPLLAGTDDKVVVAPTPKFFGPTINADEAQYTGNNDNETPHGARVVTDTTIPSITGRYAGLSPVAYDKIKKIMAWGNRTLDFATVGTYLLMGVDQIVCMKGGGPIPIRAPFISSPTGGGLNGLTYFNISFDLEKEWYADVVVLRLNFKHDILKN